MNAEVAYSLLLPSLVLSFLPPSCPSLSYLSRLSATAPTALHSQEVGHCRRSALRPATRLVSASVTRVSPSRQRVESASKVTVHGFLLGTCFDHWILEGWAKKKEKHKRGGKKYARGMMMFIPHPIPCLALLDASFPSGLPFELMPIRNSGKSYWPGEEGKKEGR